MATHRWSSIAKAKIAHLPGCLKMWISGLETEDQSKKKRPHLALAINDTLSVKHRQVKSNAVTKIVRK